MTELNPQEKKYATLKKDGIASYMKWQYPGHSKATIFEFLAFLETIDVESEKVNLLVKFAKLDGGREYALRAICECLYHPAVEFVVPEGVPPFADKEDVVDKFPTGLLASAKKLSRMIKGSPDFIANSMKREMFFLRMLESFHPAESYLLLALKEKDDSILRKAAPKAVLLAAFPGWFSEEMKKASPKASPAPTPPQTPVKNKGGRPKGSKNKSAPPKSASTSAPSQV